MGKRCSGFGIEYGEHVDDIERERAPTGEGAVMLKGKEWGVPGMGAAMSEFAGHANCF